ncbi:MAG: gamma-glutamyl-phosphate reductase [Cyanobacteria bacterium P01_D01_bin.1]
MNQSSFDLTSALMAVRHATEQLGSNEQCSRALSAMGNAIDKGLDDILEANTLDLEISRDMAVPELVAEWLKLTPDRVRTAANICHRLADMGAAPATSTGFVGCRSYGQVRPLGIVGFIYEALPDLAAIAAGLCIRTGNAVVLRGGSEASRTDQMIAQLLQSGLVAAGLSETLILPVEPAAISRLEMAQCSSIDLIIPHGRPSLVEQVVETATVPVAPSRMGNCYLYWSATGTVDQVYHMIISSHKGTPDAINRIEKVVFHESHSATAITLLWARLKEEGFELKAEAAIAQIHDLPVAAPLDWGSAYLRKTVAFCPAKNISEALEWINTHTSGHADSIATTDYADSRLFTAQCRSTALYINTSPQFVRNTEHPGEIALGISNRKGVTGGLIGMHMMSARQQIFPGR